MAGGRTRGRRTTARPRARVADRGARRGRRRPGQPAGADTPPRPVPRRPSGGSGATRFRAPRPHSRPGRRRRRGGVRGGLGRAWPRAPSGGSGAARVLEGSCETTIACAQELRRAGDETRAELTSLANRQNNLPAEPARGARTTLRANSGIDARPSCRSRANCSTSREEYAEWRGAAERVLRGFALSLLVPQQHYDRVARWVNEHRLTYRPQRRPDSGQPAGVRAGCRTAGAAAAARARRRLLARRHHRDRGRALPSTICATSSSGGPTTELRGARSSSSVTSDGR